MSTRGCTQCGNCLDVCPVFSLTRREEMSPKAKHALLEALAETAGDLSPKALAHLAECCVSCGRCRLECSRSLSVPAALAAARAASPGWRQWFWKTWILSGKRAWPGAALVSRLMPAVGPDGSFLRENIRSAKAMAAPSVPAPWLRFTPSSTLTAAMPIVIFGGCTAERVRKPWIQKAAALLQRKGYSPLSGDAFTCCGATLDHAGIPDAARTAALRNIDAWRALGRPKIAVFCASCHHGLAHYPEMPGILDDAEAVLWREALSPLSRLLAPTDFTPANAVPERTLYHSPCHWENNDPDLALLRAILPALAKGSAPCCGLGGVLKLGNPALSMDIARACWHGLIPEDAAPASVLTGCSGCVLQLSSIAPAGAAIYHWLDIVRME